MFVISLLILSISIGTILFLIHDRDEIHQLVAFLSGLIAVSGCGFLFQNYALFPHLTIAENIAFGMPTGKSQQEIKQEVERQLIAVDLPEMSDRLWYQTRYF